MNLSKSFLITLYVSFLFFANSYSQTGPGGVGNNSTNILWLKPDAFSLADNTSITTWDDTSGNGNDLSQPNNTFRPIIKNNIINSYDAIRFEAGNRRLRRLNFSTFATTEVTAFYINNTTDRRDGVLSYASSANNNDFLIFNSNSLRYYKAASNTAMNISANNGNWHMIDMSWKNTSPGLVTYLDGLNRRTFSYAVGQTITQGGCLALAGEQDSIDGNYASNQSHQGDFTEVILFNTAVTSVERIIIQNYLSAKYGLSLNPAVDFYVQDNIGVNGNYDFDVAGIGQAIDGSSHTDSQGTGIVRINSPSALTNDDYLFWGEETKNPNYNFSTNAINYNEQLNSRWRVSKRNNLGTVTVTFDLTSVNLTKKQACQPLQLVIDNNSDFSSPTNVYDLTFNGSQTRAKANNIVFNDGDYFTLRYVDQIVWDGTAFFNGSGIANAPDNTDSCLKLTVKPGATGILTTNAHVREVEIEAGAILNVSDGIFLETENQVNINGVIDLLGEAQLIQNHNLITSNSGSGFLIKRQQGVGNLFNYNYWSAPVNTGGSWQIANLEDVNGVVNFTTALNANPATMPITLSSEWLYTYNDISNTYALWQSISNTTSLSPGIGYTMKGSGTTGQQEYIFKGIPNDGNYSYAVNAGDDFLVGNPYPSALSADQFINDNLSVIDGSLRFWEQFATNNSHVLREYEGGYAIYNLMMPMPAVADASGLTSGNGTTSNTAPTPNIPVGQGFFVTINNSGSLVFNNQQRAFARESLNESIFYKSSNKLKKVSNVDSRTKIWFSFIEPGNRKKLIGLGYDDVNATYNYDNGYDSKVSETDMLRNDLHWVLGDKKLTIQALQKINIEDELPLTMEITDSGIYKFGIEKTSNLPDNINIYLKDNVTGVNYNLRTSDNTEIFLNTNEDKQRFSIVFKTGNVLDVDGIRKTNFKIAYNNQSKDVLLYGIEDLNKIQSISIHNILGQHMMDLKSIKSNTINVTNLSIGTYIIKVNFKNNTTNKPFKFVKY